MAFRFPAKTQHQGPGPMEGGGGRPAAPARVPSVFRRLLVRVTPAERLDGKAEAGAGARDKDPLAASVGGGEAEVGSVALDRMVLSFMEESAAAAVAVERPARGRCGSCFNGQDASDDDEEDFGFLPSSSAAAAPNAAAPADAVELLKGLVQCASTAERNLLADASRIAERCRRGGGGRTPTKADVRRGVAAGLRAAGYDAAVCRSRWEQGEHEYVDAVLALAGGGTARAVVEVDFRAEFEVARPTKAFRAALQALPPLFVGAPDRLGRVVALAADAARQSLRKRGLHVPPWRKPEYMRAKWLAPHERVCCLGDTDKPASVLPKPVAAGSLPGEFDDKVVAAKDAEDGEEKIAVVVASPPPWRPEEKTTEAREQSPSPGTKAKKVVTGLASVL